MVEPENFRKKIQELIAQEYRIEFLGKDFDQIVKLLTDEKAEKIFSWITDVINKDIQPILAGANKAYKSWKINELLVFRYPFSVCNNEYRIMLVKVKNSIYLEFHLGDHKYYDKVRKNLDLAQN